MKNTILITIFLLNSSFLVGQNIWEPINFPDTLHPQTINAENKDFIFVTAKGPLGVIYLLRSNDDGITWEKLNLETHYFNEFFTIDYNSDGVLFLGNRTNVFRSFDNGNNFDTVYTNYDPQDVVTKISSFDNNEVYALGLSKIIRSTDDGNSWDTIYLSNFSGQYFVDIEIEEDGNIFAVCLDFDSVASGFFRSLDNGLTWEHIGITDTDLQSINLNSEGRLIVSGEDIDGIFSSSDIGETWVRTSNLKASVMESFNNDKLIAGSNIDNSTGCWLSIDWGGNWVDLIDSVINPKVHQISISPSNHIYIQSDYSANSNQLFKSINPLMNNEERIKLTNIELYPNPTSYALLVKNYTSLDIEQYIIYNQNGQIIRKGKLIDEKIIVYSLQSGIYVIDFELEDDHIRKLFIKKE